MTTAFIDTNVFIRFFVNDDPDKCSRATTLFKDIRDGKVRVIAPHTVIDEIVFVLSSPQLYKQTRQEIASLLIPLLRLHGVRVPQRAAILKALALYASSRLDFADCVTITLARISRTPHIFSFDRDFDGLDGITRLEPESVLQMEG